jgi:tripartite-type tricarboxylate transporter receptor subunit TctC
MMNNYKNIAILLLASLFTLSCSSGGDGKTVSAGDFYKGKKLTYIVATSAGGGYDAYGRLITKFMAEKLDATILVKNMPGAGHIIGANYIFAAEPDGTTFGTFNTGLIHAQLLERKGVQFDLNEMSWIGKATGDTRVLVMSAKSQYKTIEDILAATEPVKFGTAGIGSASTNDILLLVEALGINAKIVPGFNGNEGEMSMMRGEIDGTFGSLSSLQPFVDFGNGEFVLQMGEVAADIPLALDYAADENSRSLINLIGSQAQLSRLTAGPPGIPADRLKVLQDVYLEVLSDPKFLAEADKQGLPIAPLVGDAVAEQVRAAMIQSPNMMAKITKILGAKAETIGGEIVLSGIEEEGSYIMFELDGNQVKSKVSGSRTKLTIAGVEAKRSLLVVGMACDIEYIEGDNNEPTILSCK